MDTRIIQNRGKRFIPESQENEVAPNGIDKTHIYSRLQALWESQTEIKQPGKEKNIYHLER